MNQTLLITWDIYEIRTAKTEIHGIMLRGRIRKFGLQNKRNVLCENASDTENCVRFALLHGESPDDFTDYLKSIIPDVEVTLAATNLANPVLSKLKVNKEERYTL